MKFSIIIPLFNKELYIAQTIASVSAQTFTDFEIIVVDDGSRDDGLAVVNSIADKRLRVIFQQNSGVSVARNRGIEEANGEWICFLDADDWQHPSYLAEVADTISLFQQVHAVATRFKPIPDDGQWAPETWSLEPRQYELIDNLPERWVKGIPFFTGSIVIRKQMLIDLKPWFPPGESCGEDLDLWFRVAEKTSIALLQQPLIAYRTAVASSLSSESKAGVDAPYLDRMLQRANVLPERLRRSTINYVAHEYITQARLEGGRSHRLAGLRLLAKVVRRGIQIQRWWVTLLMLFFIPKTAIKRWQHWRESRTQA